MPSLPPGFLPVSILPLYVIARALRAGLPVDGGDAFDLRAFGGLSRPLLGVVRDGKRHAYALAALEAEPSPIGVDLRLRAQAVPRPAPRSAPRPRPTPPRLPGRPVPEPHTAPEPIADPDPPPPGDFAVTLVPPYQGCLGSERLAASARLLGLAGIPRTAGGPRPTLDRPTISLPPIAAGIGRAVLNAMADGEVRAVLHETVGDLTPVPPGRGGRVIRTGPPVSGAGTRGRGPRSVSRA